MVGMRETLALETLRDELERGALQARIEELRAGNAAEQVVGGALDRKTVSRGAVSDDGALVAVCSSMTTTSASCSCLARRRAACVDLLPCSREVDIWFCGAGDQRWQDADPRRRSAGCCQRNRGDGARCVDIARRDASSQAGVQNA